jgi:hypothetical protein
VAYKAYPDGYKYHYWESEGSKRVRWREGERYFSRGVKEQFLREMRDYVRGQMS